MSNKAYLTVIIDDKTDEWMAADIYSSAPWQQSRGVVGSHPLVAYIVELGWVKDGGNRYHEARERMIKSIAGATHPRMPNVPLMVRILPLLPQSIQDEVRADWDDFNIPDTEEQAT